MPRSRLASRRAESADAYAVTMTVGPGTCRPSVARSVSPSIPGQPEGGEDQVEAALLEQVEGLAGTVPPQPGWRR